MDQKFVKELMSIGIISYREQETLWELGKRCAVTTGLPLAGAGALAGMNMGTVTVPGVGTITGSIAGALAGLVAGTLMCYSLNNSMKIELRKLANGQ